MKKDNMNGSVDLLAKAMRRVFTEAVEEGVQPIKDAVGGLSKDVDNIRENMATKDDIKTTNKNVQAQLAQSRKDISDDMKKALKGS